MLPAVPQPIQRGHGIRAGCHCRADWHAVHRSVAHCCTGQQAISKQVSSAAQGDLQSWHGWERQYRAACLGVLLHKPPGSCSTLHQDRSLILYRRRTVIGDWSQPLLTCRGHDEQLHESQNQLVAAMRGKTPCGQAGRKADLRGKNPAGPRGSTSQTSTQAIYPLPSQLAPLPTGLRHSI